MGYIASSNIKVFPSARRSDSYQRESRLFTENTVTGIIKHITEMESYVITNSFDVNDKFEFYIDGYLFTISKGSQILSSLEDITSTSIYAYITIDTGNSSFEITGQDIDSKYEGLVITDQFNNNWDSEPNIFYLKLLERSSASSSDWSVPETSKIKFTRTSLDLDIDGGHIE